MDGIFYDFLIFQTPMCTQSPLSQVLGKEVHAALRAEYKAKYGMDLLEDRCPTTSLCMIFNKGCYGRPLPKDDRVKDALIKMGLEFTEGEYREVPVYFAKSRVTCESCPFASQCDTPCASHESYFKRRTTPSMEPKEHMLVPYEDFERGKYKALTPNDIEHCELGEWMNDELPLDCLTDMQYKVFDMIVMQRLEQPRVAYLLGIGQQRVSTHYARATSKLTEYGRARKYIKAHGAPDRIIDYYVNNMNQQEIADKEQVNQSSVARFIRNWYKDNCM